MAFGGFSGTDWCQSYLTSRYKMEGVISLTRKEIYAVGGAYMHAYPKSLWSHDQQTHAQALMEFANTDGPEPLSSMCWAELAKIYKESKVGSLSDSIEKLFSAAFPEIFKKSFVVTTTPHAWTAGSMKMIRAEAMSAKVTELSLQEISSGSTLPLTSLPSHEALKSLAKRFQPKSTGKYVPPTDGTIGDAQL